MKTIVRLIYSLIFGCMSGCGIYAIFNKSLDDEAYMYTVLGTTVSGMLAFILMCEATTKE